MLVQRGLAHTRFKALALIMSGRVLVKGQAQTKGGSRFAMDAVLDILPGKILKYVSRGGLKLEAALQSLNLDVSGRIALDIGASTGGFTDCLLQAGAQLVWAVDVGKGLLDSRLRNNPKVRLMEKLNARYLMPDFFDPKPDFAVIDVSFISLTKILPALVPCLARPFEILAMVKPQFEAGRGQTKGGVVKDAQIREQAIEKIRRFAEDNLSLRLAGECPSALSGPEGNVEHFLYFKNGAA
ncbi:MAG: TlyA family RNA methyltransferase [Elusimicrobiota bacterium]